MKLLFKQRLFSWFDSYDIYDETGAVVYTVQGKLSWGHCLHIHDGAGYHIATLQEQVFTWLPKFEMYLEETYVGCIREGILLFSPPFYPGLQRLECRGRHYGVGLSDFG